LFREFLDSLKVSAFDTRVVSKVQTLPALETAARVELEKTGGRALSAQDSGRALERLLEFAKIVRAWDQNSRKDSTHLGNVNDVCQREN